MKKISLLLVTAFAISAMAGQNSVSLKYGLTSLENDDGTEFENSTFSLDGIYDLGYAINPRVDLAYVNVDDDKKWGGVSSLIQLAINGQYETSTDYKVSPYVFGGLGYEFVSNSTKCFDSQPFLQLGTGLKYGVTEKFNLLGEFKALQMLSGDNQDHEFIFSLGANMPLQASVPKASDLQELTIKSPTLPAATVVAPMATTGVTMIDSDNDGVPDDMDDCPNSVLKKGATVGKNGCEIIILLDSDNDGITDDIDKCQDTPMGKKVDASGCTKGDEKTINYASMGDNIDLQIKFDLNSARIKSESKSKIKQFAKYVKSLDKSVFVIINGYTDSSGNAKKNKTLSRERAFAIRQALISEGAPREKLRAYGKGSINPVATNDTPEGRAKNRRIEAVIQH